MLHQYLLPLVEIKSIISVNKNLLNAHKRNNSQWFYKRFISYKVEIFYGDNKDKNQKKTISFYQIRRQF